MHAMSQALGQVDSGVSAVPEQEKIVAHVRRWTGQRWQTVELDHFWAFTISTGQAQLEFLNNVWVYAKFESVLVVSSDLFVGFKPKACGYAVESRGLGCYPFHE